MLTLPPMFRIGFTASALWVVGGLLGACKSEPAAPAGPVEVSLKVVAAGYEPSELEVPAGQPFTLVVERVSDEGCGDQLVIADRDIEVDLPLNEKVRIEVSPGIDGPLKLTCGMGMYDGAIVVAGH